MVEMVPGVATEINTRTGSNRFRQLEVRWDEERLGLNVSECGQRLRDGDPSIEVLSNYNPYLIRIAELEKRSPKKIKSKGGPLTVFALGMQDGQELIVGLLLLEVLSQGGRAWQERQAPAAMQDAYSSKTSHPVFPRSFPACRPYVTNTDLMN